jgi:hypothetical protein
MDQLKLKITGITPILMHNNRLANPLDAYSQAISSKSGKRKKTIEDIWELARIEWEGGLYLYDGEIKLPMRVVNKCFERGSTKQKNGTLWKSGCFIESDYCAMKYKGEHIKVAESTEIPNPDLDKFFHKNMFQAMVKVGQSTILRTRPLFSEWSFEVTILFDPSIINKETAVLAAKDAGRLVGLCDWRIEKGGRYGQFDVEVI